MFRRISICTRVCGLLMKISKQQRCDHHQLLGIKKLRISATVGKIYAVPLGIMSKGLLLLDSDQLTTELTSISNATRLSS